MARKPIVMYPAQVVSGDAGYPDGKAKNDVTPGDKTGTPFEQKLVNELFGFQQALLLGAGIEADGAAETATASQYKQAVELIAAGQHGKFDPRHPTYGAVGDNVADDTAALNACFAAAEAAGGSVDLGGKTYRVTAKLVCLPNPDVRNGRLVLDAAAPDYFLEFATGAAGERAAVWENVTCAFANQAAVMIRNVTVAVKVRFVNCKLDGSTGAASVGLLYSEPASEFTFEECESIVPTSATSGFFTTAGKLTVRGGKVKALVGFTGLMFGGSGGTQQLDSVTFDTRAVVAGTCIGVSIGGQRVLADGCVFDNTGGSATNTAFYSTVAANTALITERGSTFLNVVQYAFTNYLALGSSVEGATSYEIAFNGASVTIPAGTKTFMARSTNASTTPATINIAGPLFAGQQMSGLISNDHTAAWSGNVSFGGSVRYDDADAALANLPSNNPSDTAFLLVELCAHRYEGSVMWYVSSAKQISLI
jgi:hypothetical protein